MATPSTRTLPGLENLSGFAKINPRSPFDGLTDLDLNHLRSPAKPLPQHLLWTGPDAVTGAGSMAIGSTEDHGWISPVTARESSLRSALAVRGSAIPYLQANSGLANQTSLSLLLPFDLNARYLISHNSRQVTSFPFTWTAVSAALESEVDAASADLWANSLLPEMSPIALTQPTSLVNSQGTPSSLTSLLTPSFGGLKPFQLSPLAPAPVSVLAKLQTPSNLVEFLVRPKATMPTPLVPALSQTTLCTLSTKPSLAARRHSWAFNLIRGQDLCLNTNARSKFTPSSVGLGLDENRLVRTGSSRLADTAMIANKLESAAAPSLALPHTPVATLGLG